MNRNAKVLKSLNLKENAEVIIPAMTYCSTAFSVINANLKPVLVYNGSGWVQTQTPISQFGAIKFVLNGFSGNEKMARSW